MFSRVTSCQPHTEGVSAIAHWAGNGVVSASLDGTVHSLDFAAADTPQVVSTWRVGPGNMDGDDGVNACATATTGGPYPCVVGMESGALYGIDPSASEATRITQVPGDDDAVNTVMWLADNTVLCGTEAGNLLVYDVRNASVPSYSINVNGVISCLCAGHDSSAWVGTGVGALLRVAIGEGVLGVEALHQEYDRGINYLVTNPSHPHRVVVCTGALCHERDSQDDAEMELPVVRTYGGSGAHSDYIRGAVFFDANTMVTCGDDAAMATWKLDAAAKGDDSVVDAAAQWKAHDDCVMALCACPGLGGVVSGCEDGSLALWRPQ